MGCFVQNVVDYNQHINKLVEDPPLQRAEATLGYEAEYVRVNEMLATKADVLQRPPKPA